MKRALAVAIALVLVAAACRDGSPSAAVREVAATEATVSVVAEGLLNPVGLAALANGDVLVAEEGTGRDDTSAGVSLITTDGRVGRVISELPSSVDSGDLSGVPLVGVAPDGATLYLSHFVAGGLLTVDLDAVELVPGSPLGPEDLGHAMAPLNDVVLTNGFDITFAADGRPVVSDASQNGVAIETADGATRFFHRFGQLTSPERETLTVDAVPTGIERVGDEYYVTLFGGCPYPDDVGRLAAVDEDRNQRTIAGALDMPIDVATGVDGTTWLLEFGRFEAGASCFSGEGYMAGAGRLSTLDQSGQLTTIVDGLDFPGAVLPRPDGSVFVTEIFSGRVLQVLPDGQTPVTPAVMVDEEASWRFENVAELVGLDFVHGSFVEAVSEDPVAAMGGGLCWIDIEGDGWLDLYVVNGHATDEVAMWTNRGGLPRNGLFRNDEGVFTDIGEGSGADLAMRGNGCVVADFDGDGLDDLFVTADGPNALLRNGGDGTFVDVAARAGVDDREWNSAAVAGDLNGDGLVDLFVAAYIDPDVTVPMPVGAFPQDFEGLADHLYLNRGATDGVPRFEQTELTVAVDFQSRGLGALLSDLDRDGDLDLYVANDGNPNRLFRNDGGDAGFTDVTGTTDIGDSGSGMGVAGGDYNGDAAFDLIVTNWDRELNAVYENETDDAAALEFRYSTNRIGFRGLGNGQTGWGTAWADVDNDTDLDLFIANGHVPVADLVGDAEQLRLYTNQTSEGSVGEFQDASAEVGLVDIGPRSARGSALADFDNDGDLDIAVNVIGGALVLLRNDSPPARSITVDLGGARPGTVAELELPGGRVLVREAHAGSSYLSSEDPRLHFGLGSADRASRVTVHLPDGSRRELTDVAAGTTITLDDP